MNCIFSHKEERIKKTYITANLLVDLLVGFSTENRGEREQRGDLYHPHVCMLNMKLLTTAS